VSNSDQTSGFDDSRLALGVAKRSEAVMSEVSVFRLYAKEAMRDASTAVDASEKRALEELACTWAQAALMSDRVFGSSWSSRDSGNAEPNAHEAA
jgi:hypothetical protein